MSAEQGMIESGKSFEGTSLAVDGQHYINCRFTNVALTYGGGALPIFENCRFEGIRLQFDNQAANTLEYLAEMSQNGFTRPVERISAAIRSQVL
jgi:hypothetical protein